MLEMNIKYKESEAQKAMRERADALAEKARVAVTEYNKKIELGVDGEVERIKLFKEAQDAVEDYNIIAQTYALNAIKDNEKEPFMAVCKKQTYRVYRLKIYDTKRMQLLDCTNKGEPFEENFNVTEVAKVLELTELLPAMSKAAKLMQFKVMEELERPEKELKELADAYQMKYSAETTTSVNTFEKVLQSIYNAGFGEGKYLARKNNVRITLNYMVLAGTKEGRKGGIQSLSPRKMYGTVFNILCTCVNDREFTFKAVSAKAFTPEEVAEEVAEKPATEEKPKTEKVAKPKTEKVAKPKTEKVAKPKAEKKTA